MFLIAPFLAWWWYAVGFSPPVFAKHQRSPALHPHFPSQHAAFCMWHGGAAKQQERWRGEGGEELRSGKDGSRNKWERRVPKGLREGQGTPDTPPLPPPSLPPPPPPLERAQMAPQWPWPLISPYEIDLSSCSPSKIPRLSSEKNIFFERPANAPN